MSTKNATTTTDALTEDIRSVQGIKENDGGSSGLTTIEAAADRRRAR